MIKLKSHRIMGLNEKCASVDDDYYLKSEVDKVIEEKDDEICNLKRWLCVARHEVAKARGKNSSNKYRAKVKEVKNGFYTRNR